MKKFALAFWMMILTGFFVASASAQMTVHYIDVAQGDATLIELQTAAILIDSGGSNKIEVRDHLIAYLDTFFARRTDLNKTLYSVIITHPHADHLQWILNVLDRYKVMNLVDNGDRRKHASVAKMKKGRALFKTQAAASPLTRFYNKIDAADIKKTGYTIQTLDKLKQAEPLVEVRFVNASRICKNPNNDSLVVRVTYGATKLLITGDAEDDKDGKCTSAIPRMLRKFKNNDVLDVDVYKAGHHGSANGTNMDYLEKMTPRISIISAGFHTDDNAMDYGHPRTEAVQQMIDLTSNSRPSKQVYTLSSPNGHPVPLTVTKAVYCTCWDGDITISTDIAGNIVSVKTTK